MPKLRLKVALAVVLTMSMAAIQSRATAATFSDPSSNFTAGPSCPTAAVCLQQSIQVLDEARGRLGQPPYQLPGNFSQLSAAEQVFVLTNLDRALYGLAPVTGLTSALDQAAASALPLDSDPVVTNSDILDLASNWAGGYDNLPLAYEGWMYDDGPGGENVDCTATNTSGCWGHRHNVLWHFPGSGPLAMGAAVGTDGTGMTSDAMLIVQGDSSYHPTYVYTWSQALAAGAAAGPSAQPGPRYASASTAGAAVRIRLRVRGRALWARVVAPAGVAASCSLLRITRAWRVRVRSGRCHSVMVYSNLRRGRYRLRVHAAGRTLTRRALVR